MTKKTISQKSHRSEKLLEVADTLSFKRLRLPSQREKGKSRRSSLDHRGQSTASLFMLQLFDSFVNFTLTTFDCKAWLVKAWTQPNCGEQADGTRLEPRHGTKNHEELFQLAFVRVGRCAVRRCVWNSKKMQPLPVVVWEGYGIMGHVESFSANCSKDFPLVLLVLKVLVCF